MIKYRGVTVRKIRFDGYSESSVYATVIANDGANTTLGEFKLFTQGQFADFCGLLSFPWEDIPVAESVIDTWVDFVQGVDGMWYEV